MEIEQIEMRRCEVEEVRLDYGKPGSEVGSNASQPKRHWLAVLGELEARTLCGLMTTYLLRHARDLLDSLGSQLGTRCGC
jgi:hypothetical protein